MKAPARRSGSRRREGRVRAPEGRPATAAGKAPDPGDVALFRRSVGPVRSVEDPRPAECPVSPRKVRPKPRGSRLSGSSAPSFALAEAGERLAYLRPGLRSRVLRDLGRGRWAVEDEVHLRGMRAAEALRAAEDFVRAAAEDGVRCVRIVHGKGLGSAGGRSVIKGEIDRWLRHHDAVDAFCSAPDVDGGTGALHVLLRRRANP